MPKTKQIKTKQQQILLRQEDSCKSEASLDYSLLQAITPCKILPQGVGARIQ